MLAKFTTWYSQAGQGLSIHARTLLSISLVLIVLLSIAGIVFDNYFVRHAENNLREQLQNQLYAILAAANEDESGRMRLPEILPDPRLNRPDSGLVAIVSGEKNQYQWQSGSFIGTQKELLPIFQNNNPTQPGQYDYTAERKSLASEHQNSKSYAHIKFAIIWEDLVGNENIYTLQVAQLRQSTEQQIQGFRTVLWQWFAGLILLLLIVQGWVLNWGLKPLRQASKELQAIENGQQEQLSGQYPKELHKLTGNINSLLLHSSATLQRYRNSLGDLAHSLKTPLAIMQSAYDSQQPQQLQQATAEQLQRIDELIAYQLQKAAIMGGGPVTIATPVRSVFEKILSALNKVYANKQVVCDFNMPNEVFFRGDQSDLMELAGNLLDNAYKYCQKQVRVTIELESDKQLFILSIIDDGPGIPAEQEELLLQRGKRADEISHKVSGHGIGLSIVTEIVHLYQGSLSINPKPSQSVLNGLCLQVSLPAIVNN